jgi:putative ribosome biogenesis GTPase RsgA
MIFDKELYEQAEDAYTVDNSSKTSMEVVRNALIDLITVMLGQSGLKLWICV